MPKIDFTLSPKTPLSKHIKAYRVKWKRITSKLNPLTSLKVPTFPPQLILSTFTHILLFFFLFFMWRVLTPILFYERLLTLILGASFYYISQTIIIKSFEPFKR